MKPTIMKFGGTSVADAGAFTSVADIVAREVNDHRLRPVVVVSAMSGFTDALLTSVQKAVEGNADGATAILDEHFARHEKIVETLLKSEAALASQFLEKSRSEIDTLLLSVAAATAEDSIKPDHKFYQDAIVSFGERLSAAVLAACIE